MWAGFDEDSIFQKNIGGAQNVFAAIHGVSDMVKTSARSRMVARVSEIIALVADRQPHSRFGPIVHHDLLGEAATQVLLKENSVRLDIHSEAIEMIEPTDIDAASREALRLILKRRPQLRRRPIPRRFIIELNFVPIWIA